MKITCQEGVFGATTVNSSIKICQFFIFQFTLYLISSTMDETTSLLENQKPSDDIRQLEILLDQLWSDQHDRDIFSHISARLRSIEGAVTRKYASLSPKEQRRYRAGEFAETLEIVRELSGWQWLWR
jgi:hypothetical protein